MASRRPSTRENPQGPPATPVSDLEEILTRARDSLRKTNNTSKEATSGISINIHAIISSTETFNSHEFINTSENFRVWESSSTAASKDQSLVTPLG